MIQSNSLTRQGSLEQVAQECIQIGFECPQTPWSLRCCFQPVSNTFPLKITKLHVVFFRCFQYISKSSKMFFRSLNTQNLKSDLLFWVVCFGWGYLSVLFFLKGLSLNTNPDACECSIPYIPYYLGFISRSWWWKEHCFNCLSSYEICQIAWP